MRACLPVWLSLLLPAAALAGDPAAADLLFELPLEDLLTVDVGVASRQPDNLRSAPSAVSVFSRDDLDRLGVRWLDELAVYVPGMRAQRTVGTGLSQWAYEFRGVPNVPGTNALLLIDGRRQNSPFSGVVVALYRRINLDNFARVEIIRGPGSALYGSNAVTGVINLVSRNDNQILLAAGEPGARYGSFSGHLQSGDLGVSLTGNAYSDRGEHYADVFDPFRRDDATQDPQWQRETRLGVDYFNWQVFLASTRNGMDDFYLSNALHDGFNHLDNHGYEVGLRGEQLASPLGTWSLQLAMLDFDSAFRSKFGDRRLPAFSSGDWLYQAHGLGRAHSVNLDAQLAVGDRHRLSYGLEYRHEQADFLLASNYDLRSLSYLGRMVEQPAVLDDAKRDVLGIYIEDRWTLSSQWTANLGLRRDRYDDIGNAASPRIGLLWQGEHGRSLKLLYAEAFRAPSLQELHFAANPRLRGNPDLQPVTTRSLEVVWLQVSGQLSCEFALFRLEQDQRIAVVGIPSGLSQYQNTGSLAVFGAEADLRYRMTADVQLGLTVGQVLRRDDQLGLAIDADRSAAVTPDTLATLAVDGRAGRWQWHASTQYNSGLDAAPQPAFWLSRLRIAYHWRERGEVALQIANALDQQYADVTDPAGFGRDDAGSVVRAAPARGRQAMIEYRYRW